MADPKKKAKAEIGVQVVERWILAALRHRTFFSPAELNRAIRKLLERLNTRPFKKLPGCRQELFTALDQPALRALPDTAGIITAVLSARRHPQQSYRSCLGILHLVKSYGEKRLAAAYGRALLVGTSHYKSIESIPSSSTGWIASPCPSSRN